MKYKKDIESIIENLQSLKNNFSDDFLPLIDEIISLENDVITVGIGKSGIIATKLSSTLCSIGIRSFFVHPIEAVHGDLGRVQEGDICIILSHSGNSPELRGFLEYCNTHSIVVCAVTSNIDSFLAKHSKYVLNYSIDEEICPNNLAPTVSTTMALTICDLIAVEIIRKTGFSEIDFKKYHPGGSLGSSLESVMSVSKSLDDLEYIYLNASNKDLLSKLNSTKFGIVVVKDNEEIKGVITDGDYRRFLEKSRTFDISRVITKNPITIDSSATIKELKEKFSKEKINIIFTTKENDLNGFVHVSEVAKL